MVCSGSPVCVSRRGSTYGEADSTVVWVRGEHDLATRASLAATVAQAADLEEVPVVVDLSAVTFMDASTIGALVGCRNRLRLHAQTLELRSPSPRALLVLELCGLTRLIQTKAVHATGAAAALGTWVDVAPIAPAGAMAPDDGPLASGPTTREVRVQAAAADEAAAAAEPGRAGP
jgi:anti-sigma B factor antagonist